MGSRAACLYEISEILGLDVLYIIIRFTVHYTVHDSRYNKDFVRRIKDNVYIELDDM